MMQSIKGSFHYITHHYARKKSETIHQITKCDIPDVYRDFFFVFVFVFAESQIASFLIVSCYTPTFLILVRGSIRTFWRFFSHFTFHFFPFSRNYFQFEIYFLTNEIIYQVSLYHLR